MTKKLVFNRITNEQARERIKQNGMISGVTEASLIELASQSIDETPMMYCLQCGGVWPTTHRSTHDS